MGDCQGLDTSQLRDALLAPRYRERGLVLAVAASGVVRLAVDSALFLGIAFGNLEFFWGQVVGKVWVTALAASAVWAWRKYRRP